MTGDRIEGGRDRVDAGPLTGVRVVDFTEYIAGPYATMMLADMGAEVIKVEPVTGDHWRHQAPALPNESRVFVGLNRGKRSVALDVWDPKGRELAHRLVATADVVALNYRPGVPQELSLDYETVRELNPAVIYADITAFGRQGPYSHRGGFDLLSQAAAGVMAYEARVDQGAPAGVRTVAVADLSTAFFTAFAIASALYRRKETGRGQAIHTNLFASAIAMQYRPIVSVEEQDATEREALLALVEHARAEGASYEEIVALRQTTAGRRAVSNYYRVYQAKDRMVAVACLNNRLRRALRDLAGVEDPSIEGPVFDPTRGTPEEHQRVRAEMEERFHARTADEWLEALDAAGVPAAPFNLTEELYEDPHVLANDLIPTFQHQSLGAVRTARTPIEMSESRTGASNPSPTLGSDTEAVLGELGLSQSEIAALEAEGVTVQWRPDSAR